MIPQSGESIGGLLRSVGLQATLLASITADPASHIDVLFLQVDHAVSKPKTKREIQQRPELRIAGLPIFMREGSAPMVLCHADLHTRNVLLEGDEQFWIVDWDETVLALKERDLMFLVGGIVRELLQPHHTEYFFRGYGEVEIDQDALAYYRHAWAVQDIAADGEQVFFMPELSDASRQRALRGFKLLFEPGNIVSIASDTG